MKKRILTLAVVTLASVFGVQQAVAKSHTTTVSAKKKHKKKHMMKAAATTPAVATSASVMS